MTGLRASAFYGLLKIGFQIIIGRNVIVVALNHENRACKFSRIDDRQVSRIQFDPESRF
jgi:hypothetical protein